jgi:hypothetical protein
MKHVSWFNLACGLWLVSATALLPRAAGRARVEDVIAGLVIALAALWATQAFDRMVSAAASWTVLWAAAWVAIAPFVLGYWHRRLATANDVIVGVLVAALAALNVWQKKTPGVIFRNS